MACATLKRSLDWEPVLGARPAKRRRCIPFCASPNHHKDRQSPTLTSSPSTSTTPTKSVFPDVVSEKFKSENMAANLRAQFKRLQRRKQLQFTCSSDNSEGNSSGGEQSDQRAEKPLFTFTQVGLICERMLREKQSEIREEYDNMLASKLAEQYDTFVKFTYDQIQKNYASVVPSYLS